MPFKSDSNVQACLGATDPKSQHFSCRRKAKDSGDSSWTHRLHWWKWCPSPNTFWNHQWLPSLLALSLLSPPLLPEFPLTGAVLSPGSSVLIHSSSLQHRSLPCTASTWKPPRLAHSLPSLLPRWPCLPALSDSEKESCHSCILAVPSTCRFFTD